MKTSHDIYNAVRENTRVVEELLRELRELVGVLRLLLQEKHVNG